MNYLELSKERYSCRKFSEKPVEKELIMQIIECGLAAPTAVNKQPYRIWIADTEETINILSAVTPYMFHAKTALIVGSKQDEAWVRKYDEKNFADVDASIVATHLMLAIHDKGLGSTWVGSFDAPKLKELIPALADYELLAIFPIGYPADDAEPAPSHCKKRAKSEIVLHL